MAKKNPTRRESAWLTVSQLADALDVSVDFVRREVLRRTPPDMVRRDCRPMRVYGRGAIEAWLKPPEEPLADGDLDLMFDPALAGLGQSGGE